MTDASLRYVVFVVAGATPDGRSLYSIADIVEPLPRGRNQSKLLRGARQLAAPDGYVLVGRADLEWPEFMASARKLTAGWEFMTSARRRGKR